MTKELQKSKFDATLRYYMYKYLCFNVTIELSTLKSPIQVHSTSQTKHFSTISCCHLLDINKHTILISRVKETCIINGILLFLRYLFNVNYLFHCKKK